MTTPLGKKIRALRQEMRLTLDELASKTGSSKSYIWELENKPTGRPSAEKIAKIAAVLSVTPEFLLNESRVSPTVSDRDQAFFRKYESLNQPTKEKLNRILDVLDSEE